MTTTEVQDRIDTLRETLDERDDSNPVLVSIIRDLWDGHPIENIKAQAARLRLYNGDVEHEIKQLVASIA